MALFDGVMLFEYSTHPIVGL